LPKRSAGLLIYRHGERGLEVFLVHSGGPLWAKKDRDAWSIPKGEYGEDEQPLAAAQREFKEETGFELESGVFLSLGDIRQAGGKIVSVWAHEGDFDPRTLMSNRCTIEWPPRSGRMVEIPEVDRGGWFTLEEARDRILASQRPVLSSLAQTLTRGR
jgi:predicted NUDIX family NTP pyrophosphohydrolase